MLLFVHKKLTYLPNVLHPHWSQVTNKQEQYRKKLHPTTEVHNFILRQVQTICKYIQYLTAFITHFGLQKPTANILN